MATKNLAADVAGPLPQFLTVAEFCERFRLSRSFAYELMQAGKIRSVRIGAARRIPTSAVQEFADSLAAGKEPQA